MAELKKHPGGMPVPAPLANAERKYREKGFPTPSGKMEFKSSIIEKYADQLALSALPAYLPPQQSHEATPELAKQYPFILNTGSRLPMFVHTRTYRLPWTRSLRPHPAADINPADARRLGIQQDDEIEIATTAGAIRVRANLTELAQPGVVHMYHGYSSRRRQLPPRGGLPRPAVRLSRLQGAALLGQQGGRRGEQRPSEPG